MKKLIPAVVMLLVSAVVLSTASYAWFTVATEATASGMSVTAEAPSSVLIREYNKGEFGASVDFGVDDDDPVNLSPASSADGVSFFVPSDCEDAAGAAAWNATVDPLEEDDEGYWLVYEFELQNAGTEEEQIILQEVNVTGENIKGAVRVAILNYDGTVINTTNGDDACTAIYNGTGLTENYVKYPTAADTYTGQAVGPYTEGCTLAGTAITLAGATTVIATLDAQATQAFRLVIWIEGQAADCLSRNANQTASVELVFGTVSNYTP